MSSISGLGSSAANDASLNESAVPEKSSSSAVAVGASSSSTSTISDSINLSADYIQSIDNSIGNVPDPSNIGSLFSALSFDIYSNDQNLSAVGDAIDTFTKSLPTSTLYDSSYTAPSTTFLSDLSNLKNAAASGNLALTKSDLNQATIDSPEDVTDGAGTALSVGDSSGETSLTIEGTANFSRYLATQGYSSSGADTEAIALTLNGLAEYATNTPTSSAQTRYQQISFLATYAAEHGGTTEAGVNENASNPLFNIISTLQNASSGTAVDQTLTNLVALYSGDGTSPTVSTGTSTTVETTTLIEYLNEDQEQTSPASNPSTSTQTLLQQILKLVEQAVKNGGSDDQSLADLEALSGSGATAVLQTSTLTVQTSSFEYLNSGQTANQSNSSGLSLSV